MKETVAGHHRPPWPRDVVLAFSLAATCISIVLVLDKVDLRKCLALDAITALWVWNLSLLARELSIPSFLVTGGHGM